MTTTKSDSLAGKVGALLISGLFGLAFGAGGLWAGVFPLVQTFGAAWSARSWVPVQARVLAADLRSSRGSKGSTTYGVSARYAYTWQGREYESRRVGLAAPDHADNIGDWHQHWHRELRGAMDQRRTVQAWVDPSEPSHAVIDKNIRWSMVAFHIPFAFLFTGVGLAACWVFACVLADRAVPFGFGKNRPASASHGVGTRSSARSQQISMWTFAMFWNLLVIPMTIIVWISGAPVLAIAMIAVFDLVGAGLLWAAIRASRKAWRYAGARLTLSPSPAVAGPTVQVSFGLRPEALASRPSATALPPGVHSNLHSNVHLRLAQYRIDDSGSSTTSRRVDSSTQHVKPVRAADGSYRVTASFDVPGDAAPSGAVRDRERVVWKLEVLDVSGSVDVNFDVDVVRPPGASFVDRHGPRASSSPRLVTVPPWSAGEPSPELPSPMRVDESDGGWHLQFGRRGAMLWGVLAAAGAAVLAAWALPQVDTAWRA